MNLPTFDDVESAARQIAGVAHVTPVATSRSVNARTGAEIFFKCENLQRAGAFKFRGAYNALSRLSPDERRRGVVAFSSGNHAQAVALAGQILDIPRVIVMPTDAPEVKRRATAGYGGELVLYDRERDDREAIGRRLASERGLAIIPPYDHPQIVAGAGTAALELFQEVGDLDLLLVPCGGGGLLGGSALAAAGLCPRLSCRRHRTRGGRRCHAIVSVGTAARRSRIRRRSPTAPARCRSVPDLSADAPTRHRHGHRRRRRAASNHVLLVGAPEAGHRADRRPRRSGGAGRCGPGAGPRVGVILSGGNIDVSQVSSWLAQQ